MIPQDSQSSLFDHGDAETVTERHTSDTKCGFCAVLRGEDKVTLIHENDHLMSFLDHRPLFHGHVLLIPKIHVLLMSDLPADRVSVPHLHLHVIPRRKKNGLRFWLGPRHPYNSEHPAELYADKIRLALASI